MSRESALALCIASFALARTGHGIWYDFFVAYSVGWLLIFWLIVITDKLD